MDEARKTADLFRSAALWAAGISAGLLALVPIANLALARIFWKGLPEAGALTKHALIAVAFFAALCASMEGKHLALGSAKAGKAAAGAKAFAVSAVDSMLAAASISLLLVGFEPGDKAFGIPIAALASPMAIGFVGMLASDIAASRGPARAAAIAGAIAGLFASAGAVSNILSALGWNPAFIYVVQDASYAVLRALRWPLAAGLVAMGFFGLPLYAVLSGVAGLLFVASGSSVELIPSEAYSLFRNDSIPAIPLFTVAGYILSESGAGRRLVALFREWFGWLPGGEALAAVLVLAFFTTFTGANGVAILALGGILASILIGSGSYDEDFTHGFLTASSSIGLLFPPSMAVIVYAVNASFVNAGGVSFTVGDMFLAGLLPGALVVVAMAVYGAVRSSKKAKGKARGRFEPRAAFKALASSSPEAAIPLLILAMYLTGFANLTEIAAITLAYVALIEGPIRKDLDVKGVASAIAKAVPVTGGALVIIAAARGLSFFTLEAGLPDMFSAWVTEAVSSRQVFLLLLNIALLVVGCFMDIFSAVLVISPLVIPLGTAYGIHPVHLGIVFIMNLSIGFLTPPIGMNLFLASYAFDKPVMRVFKNVAPFFALQLAILAAVTWFPPLSLALLPGALR